MIDRHSNSLIFKFALGLSFSSWPLLERLKREKYVDQLGLTPKAASKFSVIPEGLLVGSASEMLERFWRSRTLIIVVGAIGAVTRLVSPLLKSKETDPGLLVVDSKGVHVVPLIGGHKAGAENQAFQLAEYLGGKAVITSETSSQGCIALDSFGESWGWKRTGDIQKWNKLMLQRSIGGAISLSQHSGSQLWQMSEGAFLGFSNCSIHESSPSNLFIGSTKTDDCSWRPATLWIGIGCVRNSSESLLERSLILTLKKAKLVKEAIAGIASIDLKSDELAIQALAQKNCWPIRFYSPCCLKEVSVPNPSLVVNAETGTPSVAEASALLAAGKDASLICSKEVYRSQFEEFGAVTIAIAESKYPFAPHLGEVHLIGSGPGDVSLLTHAARTALTRSAVWFGYERYLDLLEPLRRNDQVRVNGQLTFERERCLQAVEMAKQGVRVALVSSGDSSIYGMAGLALEIWLGMPKEYRPHFQVHPGISSVQMAAARLGAPIMNDFCVLSLSDLLTPWPTIEKRLYGAAIGDFVVAIYNPRSKDRSWQLKSALNILGEHRDPDTPVALARQLGREDEEIELYTISSFPFNQVDMLSLVLVGNSHSLVNESWLLNPRGY